MKAEPMDGEPREPELQSASGPAEGVRAERGESALDSGGDALAESVVDDGRRFVE